MNSFFVKIPSVPKEFFSIEKISPQGPEDFLLKGTSLLIYSAIPWSSYFIAYMESTRTLHSQTLIGILKKLPLFTGNAIDLSNDNKRNYHMDISMLARNSFAAGFTAL